MVRFSGKHALKLLYAFVMAMGSDEREGVGLFHNCDVTSLLSYMSTKYCTLAMYKWLFDGDICIGECLIYSAQVKQLIVCGTCQQYTNSIIRLTIRTLRLTIVKSLCMFVHYKMSQR